MGRQHSHPPRRLGSRRRDWAAVPPDSPGLHASAVRAEGAGSRRARRTRSKVRGPGGGEAPVFCADAPPGLGGGAWATRGWGQIPGPPPPACEPGSAWPPGLFWGLQVSRTIEGSGRPSSRSGRLPDRRSICPAVCQQPSPRKMGEQREGAVLGPLRKFRVPGTPPRPLTLSVSPPSHRRRPRDPGPALGAAASSPLPVRLCVCVCLAVPKLVSTPELSLPDADSPRLPSPFPWQVRGR